MVKELLEDNSRISDEEVNRLIDELDNTDMEETDKMVMKELLRSNEKDIFFKTELEPTQINAIAKVLTINGIVNAQSAWVKDNKTGEKLMQSTVVDMVNVLMKLMVSKQRKGRAEFIDAWKGDQMNSKKSGLISKFFGRGDQI